MARRTQTRRGRPSGGRGRISGTAGVVIAAVAVGSLLILLAVRSGGSAASGQPGPEGVPVQAGLALSAAAATGAAIDGITCDTNEHVDYHIHARLAIFDHGRPRPLPAGIGVDAPQRQTTPSGTFVLATRCYYWLHTHAQDGVVHIESPDSRAYTLGEFFDVWQQPLSTAGVANLTGQVTAYVNGQAYRGDPRAIPLTPHANIQLDVGGPRPGAQAFDWRRTSL